MTIYTFDYFWDEFHRINIGRKTDKHRCLTIWNKCHFSDKKKEAIKEIYKTDKSAFEYLREKLSLVK